MYQKVELTLTGQQLRKLSLGQPVQLSAQQLQPACRHHMIVHPETAKKMRAARMKGSGVRIQISPQELAMSGEGLGDIWNWVKTNVPKAAAWAYENVPKVARAIKENVIDTPFYQQKIRPVLREKLEGLAESKPYAGYTVPAIEYAGDYTGAFGVRSKKTCPKRRAKSLGGSFRV